MWHCRLFVIAWVLLGPHASAQAQGWPSKPVHVIVPVTPGSAIDIVARTISDQLTAQLGQPFVVENRTGAGGTIGAAAVAKADPDGHTILVHSTAATIFPATFLNLPFDTARDFAGVTPVVNVPLVLIVSPAKHRSLKELVAAAKAKPGSTNYATVGAGAAAHMTAERLRLSAGFEAQQIPFRGAPEAQTEVLAGRVDFFFSPVLAALPLIESRQLLALAVSSSKRASALPEVPTTLELGFPNSEYNFWVGLFLPAKTPKDVVARMNDETRKAVQSPVLKERFGKLAAEPMVMTQGEFDDFIRKDIAAMGDLAKASGLGAK